MTTSMKIAVLGGGNGSFAAAGDFALQGHEVTAVAARCGTGGGASRGGLAHHRQGCQRPARRAAGAGDDRHRRGRARCRADPVPCPGLRASRYRTAARAASGRRPGGVPAAGDVRLDDLCQGRARRRQSRRGQLCRNRHAAVADAQAWPVRGRHHHPRQAAAGRRISASYRRSCARSDRPRLSRRDRALRRRAVGRADECRADHPSAADRDECRPDRAFRALGHSQGRHASRDPPGHRRARCRTHRGARRASAMAGRIFRWRIITPARASNGCMAAARTTA